MFRSRRIRLRNAEAVTQRYVKALFLGSVIHGLLQVVIEKVAAPMPISASKKSSATPWDEAFENVPEVVSRVEEAPHVSVELPSAIGAEDERMEIDEASPPRPQNTTAERVFAAPEPAFKTPRKPPVRSEGAATGTQHQKTPSTIPKKLDTAPSTHCTPNAPSKCVSIIPSLGGSLICSQGIAL